MFSPFDEQWCLRVDHKQLFLCVKARAGHCCSLAMAVAAVAAAAAVAVAVAVAAVVVDL